MSAFRLSLVIGLLTSLTILVAYWPESRVSTCVVIGVLILAVCMARDRDPEREESDR